MWVSVMGPGRTEPGAGRKTSPLNPAECTDHDKPGARPEDRFLSPKASVKECVWGLTRRGDMQGKPDAPSRTTNLKHVRQTHLSDQADSFIKHI